MRKLILNISPSLDGYIAGMRGDIDWLFPDTGRGINAFLDKIDLILMGRKTFDGLKGLWPFGELKAHVFSRSLHDNGNEHMLWVSDDITAHVKDLKKREGKDIWLMGGGQITRHFLNEGLIDEMILSIHPIVLGKGIPLFPPTFKTSHWELSAHEVYRSGILQVHYQLQ